LVTGLGTAAAAADVLFGTGSLVTGFSATAAGFLVPVDNGLTGSCCAARLPCCRWPPPGAGGPAAGPRCAAVLREGPSAGAPAGAVMATVLICWPFMVAAAAGDGDGTTA
jgi:hypothetical protein